MFATYLWCLLFGGVFALGVIVGQHRERKRGRSGLRGDRDLRLVERRGSVAEFRRRVS